MAQIPPSRTLRLRAPVSKSYRGGRYHPYARLRPSFDTEMALVCRLHSCRGDRLADTAT